jgi:hypothetical protein
LLRDLANEKPGELAAQENGIDEHESSPAGWEYTRTRHLREDRAASLLNDIGDAKTL